jgi:hypothetical protein
MTPRRGRRLGQVIIPALFLFPTLMLFVYLIYETAKLSREKIRHQFAIDAAVFVEMTNYSDFLNRTAYVNGAFPMRIFDEGFYDTKLDCDMKSGCNGPKSLWWILCQNGVFPMRGGDCSTRSDYGTEPQWDIRYGGKGGGKNSSPPDLASNPSGNADVMTILTGLNPEDDANRFWLNWDDANQIYKLYVQIYQLLGSVEDAQYSVLMRLAAQHNFLRKSYWLNTGSDLNAAAAAANLFDSGMGSWALGGGLKYYCYPKVNFYGNKPTGSMFQPWQVYSPDGGPVQMASPINGCSGLFQLMWVSPAITDKLKAPLSSSLYGSRGISVNQAWGGAGDNFVVSKNYFNHDFMADFPGGGPAVHVSVAIDGFGGAKASVWPDPTPKFQVRTYP